MRTGDPNRFVKLGALGECNARNDGSWLARSY
jgi:hypothetical protein